jgi:hypothetical protein
MIVGTVIDEDYFDDYMEEIEEESSIRYSDGTAATCEGALYNTTFVGITSGVLFNKDVYDTYGEFKIVSNDKFIRLCKEKFPKKLKLTKESIRIDDFLDSFED